MALWHFTVYYLVKSEGTSHFSPLLFVYLKENAYLCSQIDDSKDLVFYHYTTDTDAHALFMISE